MNVICGYGERFIVKPSKDIYYKERGKMPGFLLWAAFESSSLFEIAFPSEIEPKCTKL